MPNLITALLCERVITDMETTAVSYIQLIEELTAPQLPVLAPPFMLATIWRRTADEEQLRVRLRIFSPDGTEIAGWESPELEMPEVRQRINLQVGGFPIEVPGTYVFALELFLNGEWVPASNLPLDVHVQPAGAQVPPQYG